MSCPFTPGHDHATRCPYLPPSMQDGKTPLHHASFVGWVEVVQLLLDKGAEVDARNQVSLECIGRGST